MKYIVYGQSDEYEFFWDIYPNIESVTIMIPEYIDLISSDEAKTITDKITRSDEVKYILIDTMWIAIKQLSINTNNFYLHIIRNHSKFEFKIFTDINHAYSSFNQYIQINKEFYSSQPVNYTIGNKFHPYFSTIQKINLTNFNVEESK